MSVFAKITKSFAPAENSAGFTLDVQWKTQKGVTVLYGPSGSGKSLTLDCIAGFARPDSGRILLGDSILFDGEARVNLRPQTRACGYVLQNHALFPHMTLRENLLFAADRLPRLERRRRTQEMLEQFRLTDIAGRRPSKVSGGERQRCSIARALIANPRVLLFDEATRGLDTASKKEFYGLLQDLRRNYEIPLVFVTHDLDEAVTLGDQLLIYEAGRILQSGPPQEILSAPASAKVAQLLGHINILPVEILALDPGRNSSRLRTDQGEIAGPYFPGYFIGDRANLVVRSDHVSAYAHPGENRLRTQLESYLEHARFVELRFAGGLTALAPHSLNGSTRGIRDWYIEFPREQMRLIRAE